MQSSDASAIVSIINNYYGQIAAIEAQWNIRFREGDMRPRIEYFHDAVRALTSGSDNPYGKHSRLSVEYLAYDLSQLRMIQSQPIGCMTKFAAESMQADLVKAGDVPPRAAMPDREVRATLGQLYKDYTIMFAALFAEAADHNYHARCDEVDQAVEDVAMVAQILEQLAAGRMSKDQAQHALEGVSLDDLRDRIQQALAQHLSAAEQTRLMSAVSQFDARLEGEKKQIEQAHLSYVTGQLAVYEDAKETVKRLAAQGLNLAGKFVESAVSKAQGRERGGRDF